MTRIKRKRGGQQGNQNARKHGFYSSSLNPDEICRFWNTVNQESIDPEIAILRIKLQSFIHQAPANDRVFSDASRLITRWFAKTYQLDRVDRACLKSLVVVVLEQASGISLVQPERRLKTIENFEKRIGRVLSP